MIQIVLLNIFFSITPIAAYDLEDHIFESAKNLSNYPYMGVSGRALGTRELLVHPNYWIVYEVTDVISILNVIHTRKLYPQFLQSKNEAWRQQGFMLLIQNKNSLVFNVNQFGIPPHSGGTRNPSQKIHHRISITIIGLIKSVYTAHWVMYCLLSLKQCTIIRLTRQVRWPNLNKKVSDKPGTVQTPLTNPVWFTR